MRYRVCVRTYFGNGARPYLWRTSYLYDITSATELAQLAQEFRDDQTREYVVGIDAWLEPA